MHVYHSQQNTKQYYFLWISWCVPINLDIWKVLYAERCVAFFKFVLCLTNTKKKARTSGNQYNLLKKGYIVKSVVTSNRYLDKFITHHEIDYKYLNNSLLYLTRTCIINTVSIPLFIPISFGEVNQLLLNTLFQFIEHWFFFVSFFQQWSILRKRVREPLTLVFIFHTFKNLKCKVLHFNM